MTQARLSKYSTVFHELCISGLQYFRLEMSVLQTSVYTGTKFTLKKKRKKKRKRMKKKRKRQKKKKEL